MIVSMVLCPFSVSGPVLHDPVSGFSVSLCALSLVSLSISLAVLVSLCSCLSMSVSVCASVCLMALFLCPCLFVCVPDPLCVSVSVFLSFHIPVSLRVPISLCLHLCLPASPCLSPGAIQSFAGFADYFTAMAQEGWFPLLCVGLRPQWENHHLQDLQDSYGQEWVSPVTPSFPMLPTQSIPDTQTLCQFRGKGLSCYRLELQTPASAGPSCRWVPSLP